MIQTSKLELLEDLVAKDIPSCVGVRLGESAVVSKRVHVVDPSEPEKINIIEADAGQVFYGRQRADEIFHIDVFHQVGIVNQHALASSIITMLKSRPNFPLSVLDRVDIQTASGGGRLTGSLTYGRKLSLRRAHANHVHLAAGLNPEEVFLLAAMVAAVEQQILEQGLEIRKIERVCLVSHNMAGHISGSDLSSYSTESDSVLKTQPGSINGKLQDRPGMEIPAEIRRIIAETLPPSELLKLLELCPLEPKAEHRKRWGTLNHVLEILQSEGILEKKGAHYKLTKRGKCVLRILINYLPELESKQLRLLRQLTPAGTYFQSSYLANTMGQKRLRDKELQASSRAEGGNLNLAATVKKAACRWIGEPASFGKMGKGDLVYTQPQKKLTPNIILVIDCSASMAGKRLLAARILAQHLVLATRGKVAVITFQENEAVVASTFTSSLVKIQTHLLQLEASGLTPMAKAIALTHTLLTQRRVRKPFVVLITDGIPTVPMIGNDASSDALKQAEKFKTARAQLLCIGLDPNQSFLEKLSSVSGGQLRVVKELEAAVLAQIVYQEIQRR